MQFAQCRKVETLRQHLGVSEATVRFWAALPSPRSPCPFKVCSLLLWLLSRAALGRAPVTAEENWRKHTEWSLIRVSEQEPLEVHAVSSQRRVPQRCWRGCLQRTENQSKKISPSASGVVSVLRSSRRQWEEKHKERQNQTQAFREKVEGRFPEHGGLAVCISRDQGRELKCIVLPLQSALEVSPCKEPPTISLGATVVTFLPF